MFAYSLIDDVREKTYTRGEDFLNHTMGSG